MNNENLNKKLLALQASVRALAKNADGFGYQYVSGSKLLYFIRPKMDELGLRLVPNTIDVDLRLITTTPADEQKGKPAKQEMMVLLHKTFTWIDVESGESETTDFYAQGCNGFDKGIGSAETYAERYFLLKYFHIATDEDDVDAIQHESATVEESPKAKDAGKKTKAKKQAQEEEAPSSDTNTTAAESIQQAVKLAQEAGSSKELTDIWNANKGKYGLNPEFVLAISKNPNNPRKR
jgi:hypothetical protein